MGVISEIEVQLFKMFSTNGGFALRVKCLKDFTIPAQDFVNIQN